MATATVPKEAINVYNRALELANRGEIEKSLEEYRRAIQLHAGFVEAYNNIGEIYSRMGKRDLAIASYNEALKFDRNGRVLLNLGVEHYNGSDYGKSLQFFKESLAVAPDLLEGHFYTGLVYYNEKNYREAEPYLKRVIGMDRKHLKANYLLSHIYYEQKEYQKTIACLDNIRDIADDKSFVSRYYGFCHYYLGNFDLAVEHLTQALHLKPEYKKFKKYLAGLTYEKRLKEIGDVGKAIREMEGQMMKGEPQIAEATKLSMLYIFDGQNQKAEQLLLSLKQKLAS
ncbi:MAG: tetratricopeptide repeat protein [Spirochaetes bacterium]|nr:tetratricopeptide repeat protein [Spirochaetota bacterium]